MPNKQLKELMVDAVIAVLQDLRAAYAELMEPTTPQIALPAPSKQFEFASGVIWPNRGNGTSVNIDNFGFYDLENETEIKEIASIICEKAHYVPRNILSAIAKIETATAWCRHQTEIKRLAAEVLIETQREELEKLKLLAARLAKPQ